jgi:PAS domain-containing protein
MRNERGVDARRGKRRPRRYGRIAALEVRATAVRKAERARRESETRYRVLAEQSSLGIVIHKDFIVRYANPALVTLFGYDAPQEVVSRDLRGVLAPSDRPRVERYGAVRLQGEPVPAHEITRLKYMPDQAHNLPPTLDIRRSSQEGPEADPS